MKSLKFTLIFLLLKCAMTLKEVKEKYPEYDKFREECISEIDKKKDKVVIREYVYTPGNKRNEEALYDYLFEFDYERKKELAKYIERRKYTAQFKRTEDPVEFYWDSGKYIYKVKYKYFKIPDFINPENDDSLEFKFKPIITDYVELDSEKKVQLLYQVCPNALSDYNGKIPYSTNAKTITRKGDENRENEEENECSSYIGTVSCGTEKSIYLINYIEKKYQINFTHKNQKTKVEYKCENKKLVFDSSKNDSIEFMEKIDKKDSDKFLLNSGKFTYNEKGEIIYEIYDILKKKNINSICKKL
jgi:hypothetical protein